MAQMSYISAATYYASPNGNGDGKSYENPTTFALGLKLLKNGGDTLYLLDGQYDLGTTDVNNLVGSASKRIVISGYNGINEQGSYNAILDFRQTVYGKRGLQIKNTCAYLHIKNLTLRYSGKNNLICYASYNIFENLDIYGSADTGCQMKEGGNNVIKNVDSHDNFDYQTMSGGTANFGGNADGFADKQFTGDGNHYINCRAWNNSDDGWDFFQRVSNSNTVIENCVCYANGAPYYDMSSHPRALGVDKTWFDSKVGTQMVDRYGQTITITLDKYPCQGNGNGFKMGGQGTNHNILIHHSLAVGNYARGFDQNNNNGNMYVYNNTAYNNYVNYGFTTAYGTNYMQNNISFASKNSDAYKSQTNAANNHNTWNSGYACSSADFQSLEYGHANFMYLKEGSALIDAGVDVNLGYNGSAPDLGCFESSGERHDPEPDPEPEQQTEGTHAVAFVTIPNSAQDKALITHLKANDSIWIEQTNANDNSVDYSKYELIVIGSVPSSASLGFTSLKGYNKPIVLLKPFLLKPNAWNWGNAVNTQDLSIKITNRNHALFRDLTINDGQIELFSQCTTNAVTAISDWYNTTGFTLLGSPVSQPAYTTVAEFEAGSNCNGTVLPQKLIMIGVSEYSTEYLTTDGKQLIENAILYLLGITMPQNTGILNEKTTSTNSKFIQHGKLFIQVGSDMYNATGSRICR